MKLKLSIITVNLNDKLGLDKTIASIVNQAYDNYELIVIDGGSTDGSLDVINHYKEQIFYWISEPDKGIYNAMNKGITVARGEYCFFLNAGDLFVSNDVLSEIFDEDPHTSFICGNFVTEKVGVLTQKEDYKNRTWEFALYDIFLTYLCHQAFFIRTDNFSKYGLYDESLRIISDWKFFLVAIGIHHELVLYKDVYISVFNIEGLSNTIGGKAIYKEKQAAIRNILPMPVIEKLERLYYLEQNGFVVDFVHSKKWIHFLFRCFLKFCTVLRISKIS